MNNHIRFRLRGFLLSSSFVVRPEFQAAVYIALFRNQKNAPRRDVRLNDVNWSKVATSLLRNNGYQTQRKKDL